jgi:hypothetical protein
MKFTEKVAKFFKEIIADKKKLTVAIVVLLVVVGLPITLGIALSGGKNAPIYISLNRANAANNNGWDTSAQEPNANLRKNHDNFIMGQLLLKNCAQNSDGTYSVANDLQIELLYEIQQDYQNLPISDDTQLRSIGNDASSGTGYLSDKTVGYGGWYYQVKYTDGTSAEGGGTDFFKNTSKGATKTIVNSNVLDSSKTVQSISFYLIYEVHDSGQGVLGAWWNEYTNWVNSYTINFK